MDISHLIRDNKILGNLMGAAQAGLNRHSRGFMASAPEASAPGSRAGGRGAADDFLELVALAQAQAEKKAESAPPDGAVGREMAKNIAAMSSMKLRSARLASSPELDDLVRAGDPAAKVWRSNLEALISSDRFGNLLGHRRGGWAGIRKAQTQDAGAETGNLNGLRRGSLKILTSEEADKLSYGLFSPLRGGESAALNDLGPDDDYWLDDPLKGGFKSHGDWPDEGPKMPAGQASGGQVLKSDAAVLKAQREEAAKAKSGGFSREELDKLIGKVSLALDLDPSLVKAVIKTESNFDHKAVSRVGAKGLMQLMPGTAKDLGVKDPFNPVENVWAGARYLKKMLDRHGGNLSNALASYNWGPGNFDRKGKSNMPGETRRYISTVTRHYSRFKKESASRA